MITHLRDASYCDSGSYGVRKVGISASERFRITEHQSATRDSVVLEVKPNRASGDHRGLTDRNLRPTL